MNFPVLSIITFTPTVAAVIMLLLPAQRKNETRAVALAAAIFALILSFWVYFHYDQAAGGYQFIEKYNWLPALGISLQFGVDGISTPLVLLTGVVMFTGVLISWGDERVMAGIQDRPREFFAFLFILASGVFGVAHRNLGLGGDARICCDEVDLVSFHWFRCFIGWCDCDVLGSGT